MRNSSLTALAISLSLTLIFLAGEPTHAQQPDRPRNPLTINTDLVVTWAQITNGNDGTAVKGLGIDDFLLREEGKPQQISLVKEGQPVSVVILVDGMVCIWPPELEFQRSHEALRQLGDDAEIALMAWDSDVVLVQPMTTDKDIIAGRLGNRVGFFQALNGPRKAPRPQRDWYRPGEAIYQAAGYLEKKASPGRRKIIILISWFNPPLITAETHLRKSAEVNELLDKTGTTVYGLYLTERRKRRLGSFDPFDDFPFTPKKVRRRSGGTVEQFVEQAGGSILVGEREGADDLFIKLTGLIRSSYTIAYYPENSDFDGRFRRISLELSGRGKSKTGKVNIKTRNGYRALRPSLPDTSETKN